MDPKYRAKLRKQGNLFVGEHTAVEVCGWTKKSLRGEGVCYKSKFYGIKSHRCVQMSPAMNFCDHDCIFCWRMRNNSGFGKVDDPVKIIEKSIDAQRKLLTGFGGNDKTDHRKYEEAKDPLHFAISLNGEPTYYPKLSEMIRELNSRGFSSFVVSNGQLPDVIRKMEPPTQLYISVDAPNEKDYKIIDRPMRKDGWERLMRTLDIIRELREHGRTRTVLRITIIKGFNDHNPEEWATLIKKANPMFVEVKGYMFVGASRQRLSLANMPRHNEVVDFAKRICEHCGYTIVSKHEPSRVCLLMEKKHKDASWRFISFTPENKVWKKRSPEDLPAMNEDGRLVDEVNDISELTPENAEKILFHRSK